jgi:hypothetical protein
MIKPIIGIVLSFAFVIWGLYGFFVYALPLLFDFSWQSSPSPMNPEVLSATSGLARRDGFLCNLGAGVIFDIVNEDK